MTIRMNVELTTKSRKQGDPPDLYSPSLRPDHSSRSDSSDSSCDLDHSDHGDLSDSSRDLLRHPGARSFPYYLASLVMAPPSPLPERNCLVLIVPFDRL